MPLRRRPLDGATRGLYLGVAAVGLAPEAIDQMAILLGGETRRLPHECGAALLLDLFRKPFDRLARGGIGRKDPDGVVKEDRPQTLEPAPDGEPEPAGLAGQTGGQQDPGRTGHEM